VVNPEIVRQSALGTEDEDCVRTFGPNESIGLVDFMGSDHRIVNAARVSFHRSVDEDKPLSPQDARIISFMATHGHDSPFFHPMISLRIRMPLFMAREWFRHTVGFSRNEVSRRYVTMGVDCFLPASLREEDKNKKQGSKESLIPNNDECLDYMQQSMERSIQDYRHLLSQGVCAEQARLVLPQSMMTEFVETASLSAYARLYRLRNHKDAQAEIRLWAVAIGTIMEQLFPIGWAALNHTDTVISENTTKE
jgi:thymidylate synthase (FAD)